MKASFADAFDWSFGVYGLEYAAFADGGIDGGFFKSDLSANTDKGSAPVIFSSHGLEATRAKVKKTGGVCTSRSRAGTNWPCGRMHDVSAAIRQPMA
jgi:predicted enzyme related to lactoylglutathione lyase